MKIIKGCERKGNKLGNALGEQLGIIFWSLL